jgi:hypothetical protein
LKKGQGWGEGEGWGEKRGGGGEGKSRQLKFAAFHFPKTSSGGKPKTTKHPEPIQKGKKPRQAAAAASQPASQPEDKRQEQDRF